jgi:integrase
MTDKIFLRELDCYINASEEEKEHPLRAPNRCFDLTKLPNTGIRKEMERFIRSRGRVLTALSIKSDLYPYNQLSNFLRATYPELKSFVGLDLSQAEKKCKVWLLKGGKNLTQKRRRTETGKTEVIDSDVIKYLRKVIGYFNKEEELFNYESDVWYLQGIPITLKENPAKKVKSISFKKILQETIREEMKKILYVHLSQKALGTVLAELTAINRFSSYLSERYPKVGSLHDIDRGVIEEYLLYTNTEATGRKSYTKELHHLKSILNTAVNVLEDDGLNLFYIDDIGKEPIRVYKAYSDSELIRLNKAIVEMDVQIARALTLHQLLGTRISETLSLKQNAVRLGETGRWLIRIDQVKSRRSYEKVINGDVKALFDKACLYTNEKFGKQEYVFVNEKNPVDAMQYGRIQYQIMAMITKNNLTDDNGEKFGVGTHIFRHCYGKKLTEMHVDDVTIAKLLGHSNTSNIKYYRKIGDEMLSRETKQMRDAMDDVLRNIIGDWNDW